MVLRTKEEIILDTDIDTLIGSMLDGNLETEDKGFEFTDDVIDKIQKLRDKLDGIALYQNIAIPNLGLLALLTGIENMKKELDELKPKGGVAKTTDTVIAQNDYATEKGCTSAITVKIDSEQIYPEIDKALRKYLKEKIESRLAQRFEGFDYKAYWAKWEKEHPGQSKEVDWGKAVGKELKW